MTISPNGHFNFSLCLKGINILAILMVRLYVHQSLPSKFVVSPKTGITKEISAAFLEWDSINLALISLLLAILTNEAMEYVLGCRTAFEAWTNLVEQYAFVSKSRINH